MLLSFIVKSVQHNIDAPGYENKLEHSENSSDIIAIDTAIIKILYENERRQKELGISVQ